MWQRIKTAIVLVLIVGVAMFATRQPFLFLLLLGVGLGLAGFEWAKLVPNFPLKLSFAAQLLCLAAVGLYIPQSWVVCWVISAVVWILAAVWVRRYPSKDYWYKQGILLAVGTIVLVSAIIAMYALWRLSAWWLLYVFLLVWCADSGAYFVGRKLGKTKLAPNVSPNKSVEGLAGGIAVASFVAVGVGNYLKLSTFALVIFLGLSGITVGASVLGDLFESMLKRRAGVKDSGTILPGHGGVLDRIDSLLSATPIFALGMVVCDMMGITFAPYFAMIYP